MKENLVAVTILAMVIAACSDTPPPADAAPAPTTMTAVEPAATPITANAAAPAASGEPVAIAAGLTGIESCDQYLTEYEACFASANGMPPEAIAGMRSGLESTRDAWRLMQTNGTQADAMAASCKTALESLPQLKSSLGC